MRVRTSALASAALPALALAATIPNKRDTVPTISGMSVTFSDTFAGNSGDSVNTDVWNIATCKELSRRQFGAIRSLRMLRLTIPPAIDTNAELQTYTTASSNLQLSGGSTVQMVPWKSSSGVWTSGRIETKGSWTPEAGKKMRFQVSARTGGDASDQAQGMWPGIWMLGDSIRHGTGWPACGEIDIMEMVNGLPTAYGTIHCTDAICNPDTNLGYQKSVSTDDDWHSYAVEIDRSITTETISFIKDDATYFTASESQFSADVWTALAHSPMYLILNLAVGGTCRSHFTQRFKIAPGSNKELPANMTIQGRATQTPRRLMAMGTCSRLTTSPSIPPDSETPRLTTLPLPRQAPWEATLRALQLPQPAPTPLLQPKHQSQLLNPRLTCLPQQLAPASQVRKQHPPHGQLLP